MRVQSAAARSRESERDVEGAAPGRVLAGVVRSCAVLATTIRKARNRAARKWRSTISRTAFPGSRRACRCSSEGVKGGRISLHQFVELTSTQSREALWSLSEQRHDRGRRGCGHRRLGSGEARDDRQRVAASRRRLHALRRHRSERLAASLLLARRTARGGRQASERPSGTRTVSRRRQTQSRLRCKK